MVKRCAFSSEEERISAPLLSSLMAVFFDHKIQPEETKTKWEKLVNSAEEDDDESLDDDDQFPVASLTMSATFTRRGTTIEF